MFINAYGFYVPAGRVPNAYYESINGLTAEWIAQRTGIETRSRVQEGETGVTMGKAAVANAIKQLPYPIQDIDLIISAGYAPEDTVGTLAHIIQNDYHIENAKTMMISAACSSCVNAVELIDAYFKSGKASKALLISSEINSTYANEEDQKCGHLWGDAAIAMFVSKDPITTHDPEIVDITTSGLGHIGKGPEGVKLSLAKTNGGIQMEYGRDVFIHATHYMTEALNTVATNANTTIQNLDYIIAHQANMRIISNMLHLLDIPESKSLNNIRHYGNTGSASAFLVLMEHWHLFKKDMLVGLTVFGGGYSSGAILIRF
ncbi:MAG: ketoacyl-ACP synthase III [Bacteroidales bacterium]|jgi:3-oxoacyl-[acyl-carrier-protein] synthase-3|nr:ketoacyl-ACP synthase III [Bacteroidales bacterium]